MIYTVRVHEFGERQNGRPRSFLQDLHADGHSAKFHEIYEILNWKKTLSWPHISKIVKVEPQTQFMGSYMPPTFTTVSNSLEHVNWSLDIGKKYAAPFQTAGYAPLDHRPTRNIIIYKHACDESDCQTAI